MDTLTIPKKFPNTFLVVATYFGALFRVGLSSSSHVSFDIKFGWNSESSNVEQRTFTLLTFCRSRDFLCTINGVLSFASLISISIVGTTEVIAWH